MARDAPPLAVPWNLPYSLEAYVARRDAVAADCRLTTDEEQIYKTSLGFMRR